MLSPSTYIHQEISFHVIRNAISVKEYIETYVKNHAYNNIPSDDTVFRRIKVLHQNQDDIDAVVLKTLKGILCMM